MHQDCQSEMDTLPARLYDPAVAEPPQGPEDARALLRRLQGMAAQQPEHAAVFQELIGKLERALRQMPEARRSRSTRLRA